jgi:DNA-binding NarL/FixJ family response regulator
VTGGAPGGGPIRLFVCDDAADLRLLLRYAAEDEPDLELVGEAADGEAGIAGVAAARPDVVLVDLTMPRVDGIEAIPRMLAAAPAARVVAMSGHPADHMERRARDAGAAAYVQKGIDLEAILAAIRRVAAGGRAEG